MSRPSSLVRLSKSIVTVLVVSALAIAGLGLASADPPKPSGAASAAELAAAAEEIVKGLDGKDADETARKAYVFAILANAVSEADGDAKWKASALPVRDAAITLAKGAKSQATVDKQLKEINGLLEGGKGGAGKPMKYLDIASLEMLMKDVNKRDVATRKNLRGTNFARSKEQIARDAQVWAVVAAVARTDTKSAATAKKPQADFEKYADAFFNGSKSLAAAAAKGDLNAANDAYKAVKAACTDCHTTYRPDIE